MEGDSEGDDTVSQIKYSPANYSLGFHVNHKDCQLKIEIAPPWWRRFFLREKPTVTFIDCEVANAMARAANEVQVELFRSILEDGK